MSKRADVRIVEQSEHVMKLGSRDDAIGPAADLNHAFARGHREIPAKREAANVPHDVMRDFGGRAAASQARSHSA